MALNDDSTERDPALARLMAAAGGESPPAALDDAIRAAARREVSARPLAGGGGSAASAAPRARRTWYVPVSIAAVMVLSVSLVTLVHEEKGDELARPPAAASAPVPDKPAAEAPAASAAQAEAALNAAQPAPAEEKTAPRSAATPVPEMSREPAKPRADIVAPTRETQTAAEDDRRERKKADFARQQPADAPPAPRARAEDRAAPVVAPTPPATPPARRPIAEPFPEATEREAPAAAAPPPSPPPAVAATPAAPPSPASADAMASRGREAKSERAPARAARQEAPAEQGAAAPEAPAVSGRAAAPPLLSGALSSPSRQTANRPATAALKSAQSPEAQRAALWRDLENQPAEAWLTRIATYRREGRSADADVLFGEFQRRFPDHPAAVR